ncbi:hypothetical protein [Sediminibacterium sp.]|uniref:hypothetical protein n=1 Tax=Sediminibacterium sp. TaxID=1917865 RepID=UPI003F6FAE69
MKQLIFMCTFFAANYLSAQTAENKLINFYLKNAAILPKKVTLISYSPGVSGNATYGYFLVPGFKKSVSYTVGTKLYLANSKQIGVVMSGKRIDTDKPFLVVSASDANKTIKIN